MTFVYPNILWGLLAASLPLIIHLISLRSTKTIEFSSIRHIKSLENKTIKKLKIMQWILIALRMGIICTLIIMFSGPIQVNDSSWIPSEKESEAVIIIDNSASMSVTIDRDSFLDDVKSEIPKILSSFDGLVNLNVFQTTPPEKIFSGIIEEGMVVKHENWNINQSVGRDRLWTLVDSVLKSIDSSLPNRECFILSDFQVSPPTNYKDEFKGWRFYCFGRGQLNDNIAITDISTMNKIKLPNHLLKLNTKIENMGSNDRQNVSVELYLNEERVGQIVSHFKMGREKDFLFQVFPNKSGVIRGKLQIPRDDFIFDNQQTFELNIPNQISCKVISSSQDGLFMLKTVLESISGKDQFLDIELRVMPEIERLYLDETDVLILQDPKVLKPSSIEAIKRFLADGGSVLWFSAENYKTLDDVTISNLQLPIFENRIQLEGESFFTVNVINREDPLLWDLNLRNLESALPQVFIYNEVNLKRAHKPILTLNNNAPFLIDIPYSGSQIYFFTSPLDLRWNDFTMKGLLIPIIHRLLILSATNELNTTKVEVDMPKIIKISKELINHKWSVQLPSGNRILVVPDYNKEVLFFDQTTELGSYEVFAGEEFYTAFSTTLSPYESPKLRLTSTELSATLGDENLVWIDNGVPIKETIESQRHGRSLWRTFLIIAISLFMLESYISRPKRGALKSQS